MLAMEYKFVFFGECVYLYNKSYISPQIRSTRSDTCSAPRESSELDLSIPQIKVMWKLCCQTGWPIFSLLGMFFFSPPFCSRSLSIPLCLSFGFSCAPFFLFPKSSTFIGQACRDSDYSVWVE